MDDCKLATFERADGTAWVESVEQDPDPEELLLREGRTFVLGGRLAGRLLYREDTLIRLRAERREALRRAVSGCYGVGWAQSRRTKVETNGPRTRVDSGRNAGRRSDNPRTAQQAN